MVQEELDPTPNHSEDEDSLEEGVEKIEISASGETAAKKKRKRPKKKKALEATPTGEFTGPIDKVFPDGRYPIGDCHDYVSQKLSSHYSTMEEAREAEKIHSEQYNDLRKAAEVHKRVRANAQAKIKPGMTMTEIANLIENGTRSLLEADKNGLGAGIAFPTGLSLNHCAAHYTPNPGDTTVLQQGDVLKVDIGVQVRGRIIDSAFTMTFDPQFDGLKEAVRAATNTGVKEAGIDVRLGELGGLIQETMESHEVVIHGKTFPVRCIRNLNGHTIGPYHIHHGKTVPIVATNDSTRMEEGDLFAVETFGSTGKGYVNDDVDCSHYMLSYEAADLNPNNIRMPKSRALFNTIKSNFGTLAFCKRYLERLGESKYQLSLKNLVDLGIVDPHPPLVDIKGCYTAQFEHTFILRPTCKEVLSRGTDY
jgi:methionyl aminopeptidase